MDSPFYTSLLRLVLGLGGWAVLTSAVAAWIARLAFARFTTQWTQTQQAALENVRAEIARNQSVLSTAIGAVAASHSAANERRFVAIEELWKAVVRTRERTPPILTMMDILLPEESEQLFGNRNFVAARQAVTDQSIADLMSYATGSLESHRPFLGEYLWSTFFAYRAFILRSAFLVLMSKDLRSYRPWYEDPGIRQLLGAVLSKDEIEALLNDRFAQFEKTRSALEAKMLEYANRVVSGEVAGSVSLAQVARIRDAAVAISKTDV